MPSWDLGDGYLCVEADHARFARFHAFYRPDPWMRDSASRMGLFCDGTPCRLIEKDGAVVGGCLAGDGVLGEFFTIPPYQDRAQLVRRVALYLRRESAGRVWAYNVLFSEVDAFHRIGFRLAARLPKADRDAMDYSNQFMRMMIRPVYSVPAIQCAVQLKTPRPSDAKKIGALLAAAYGSGDAARPERGDFEEDARDFFKRADDVCRKASTLAVADDGPVGVCLITRWEGLPLLFDVAVAPKARHGGIARAMILRAMDALDRAGETQLRLFLECGNPAESLYHSMGFIACEATTSMYLE